MRIILTIIGAILLCLGVNGQTVGLQIDTSHSVLFGQSISSGGTKMMWIPRKGALRAGSILSNEWDLDSIGANSVVFGTSCKGIGENSITGGSSNSNYGTLSAIWGSHNKSSGDASATWGIVNSTSGNSSAAWGNLNATSGSNAATWGSDNKSSGNSTATWGNNNHSSGYNSATWGYGNTSIGNSSATWGQDNISFGRYSSSWGYSNISQSYAETVIGQYADTVINADPFNWKSKDQLLVVGNGTSTNARNNALTIYKSGNAEIDGATKVGDIDKLTRAVLTIDDRDSYDRVADGSTVRVQSPYATSGRQASISFGMSRKPGAQSSSSQNGYNINQSAIWNTYNNDWASTMRFGVRDKTSGDDNESTFDNLHEFMSASGSSKRVTISQVLNVAHSADPVTPLVGDIYYNTTDNKVRVYTNTGWRTLAFE